MNRRKIITYFLTILSTILFGGCSSHLDIASYKAVTLKPLPNHLKVDESSAETMRVVILNIDDHINGFAQKNNTGHLLALELGNKLVEDRRMQVIKRLEKATFLDEQKLYELVKKHNVDLESSDYLLTGKITQATRKKTSTKITKKKKPKKKKIKANKSVKRDIKKVLATIKKKSKKIKKRKAKVVISKKVSYRVCLNGAIRLFKLPSMQVQDSFPFEECKEDEYKITSSKKIRPNYNQVLREIIPKAIDSVISKISLVAKPQGTVSGMRINKKGDKILQTTLNRKLGAMKGREVEILRKENKILIPIAKGVVSDYIMDSYSFIILKDSENQEFYLGDIVRVK